MKHPIAVIVSVVCLTSDVSAQQALDAGVDGCFRQNNISGVVCRIYIQNNSSSELTTTFNTSSDGRTGGLDEFASWVWDKFGMQHQIVDAEIGGNSLSGSISDWRVRFSVPGNMRIPGQFIVRGISSDTDEFARIKLVFSPKFNVSRGVKIFRFDDIPIE